VTSLVSCICSASNARDAGARAATASPSSSLSTAIGAVDNMTLRTQLAALERRVGAGDRETISHPQHASAHDDVACAACGALVLAATDKKSWIEVWACELHPASVEIDRLADARGVT
jgi:hypothetical protein